VQKSFDALVDDDGRAWHVGQHRFHAQAIEAVTPTVSCRGAQLSYTLVRLQQSSRTAG